MVVIFGNSVLIVIYGKTGLKGKVMKNKNELFREATLRICGNLEIDEALHDLLLLLLGIMPVSRIYLQHYDDDYHAMRTIAYASKSEYGKLDLLTPLSETAREKAANAPDHQDAFSLAVSDSGVNKSNLPYSDLLAYAMVRIA